MTTTKKKTSMVSKILTEADLLQRDVAADLKAKVLSESEG